MSALGSLATGQILPNDRNHLKTDMVRRIHAPTACSSSSITEEYDRRLPRAPAIGVVFDRELPKGRAKIPIIEMGSTSAVGERPNFIVHILSVQARIARRQHSCCPFQ